MEPQEKVFVAERYPMVARVGAAAGAAYEAAYDPEHAFEFGLQRVLERRRGGLPDTLRRAIGGG